MKILLAEDDIHIQVITQLCLETLGKHNVEVAADGEQALILAKQQSFDLIILDGMMPKKSGKEVAQELLKNQLFRTPIIFLTAKSDPQELVELETLGIGRIAKPFDPQSICAEIDTLLSKQKTRVA